MVPIKLYSHNKLDIIEHYKRLSQEDRRMRFGYSPSDELIEKYVNNAFTDRDIWFGIIDDEREIVAVAHVSTMSNNEAEFGLSINQNSRGKGYGNLLFERAISACKVRGITGVFMQCLSENKAMRHMATKHKMSVVTRGGESEAHGELQFQPVAGAIEEVGWTNITLIDNFFRSTTSWYKWLK